MGSANPIPSKVSTLLESSFKWDRQKMGLLLAAIVGNGGDDVKLPMGPNKELKMKIVKKRFEKIAGETVDETILWEGVKKLRLCWGPGC